MNWLNFFKTKTIESKHNFGRGINANAPDNEDELYNNAYEAFEKKDILNAYKYFFESIENFSNNISNKNIIYKENENLNFELYQGCAKITGYVTQKHLYAEVIITKKYNTHVALKRYVLEKNYQLTYSNYCTDESYVKLKLYHDNIIMNPQKIFYPLRELALNADFDKEYIKNEFSDIVLEDIEHIENVDENELQLKYHSLKNWITELENKVSTLPSNDSTGMLSFIYLNILFKIDYLLVPKYKICQEISKKVQLYFNDENLSIETKNEDLKLYVDELKNIEFDQFKESFYISKYTFDSLEKTPHEEITNFINESLIKIRWYKNNRYNQIIPILYKYISFYILYNYSANVVIKSLIHVLVEVQNTKYFEDLGYNTLYDVYNETFSKKIIINQIEDIIKPHQSRYKSLKPFGDKLNFLSMNEFSNSFYLQLNNLNFEEI